MGSRGGTVDRAIPGRSRRVIERGRTLLTSRFVRDTFALQIGKLGTMLLSFISTFIMWRLLGPGGYGVFGIATSFLTLFTLLDLTGLGTSTASRLAVAIGAKDSDEARDLIAFHLQTNVLVNVGLLALVLVIGQPVADAMHDNSQIGDLAAWLAVALIADGVYSLIMTALQARRSMRVVAVMSVINQFVLSMCLIVAVVIDARPEALVAARLVYSYVTLAIAIGVYIRTRENGEFALPTLGAILGRVGRLSGRSYWRYGFANAIDKNLADGFLALAIQVVAIIGGNVAVGYLNLAMTGITNTGILTSAIFENLKAVVPQAVGRRDYAGLWRGIRGALIALAVGSVIVYAVLALVAMPIIPPVLGEEWIPAIPALIALTPFGVITSVTGVFGPIYRALNLMRQAILAKVAALLLVLLPGTVLLFLWADGRDANAITQWASVGGALLIGALFLVQGLITAWAVLPKLRALAHHAEAEGITNG